MAAPNRNYELKKHHKYVLNSLLFDSMISNLMNADNDYFIQDIHFASHFAAPWTLHPGAIAPLPTPLRYAHAHITLHKP